MMTIMHEGKAVKHRSADGAGLSGSPKGDQI
jgi:hypothetical protein